ncbi:hypothetical protein H2248_003623 [Termitomyces sp. 'cryptogamus']|nr:hypothetical protein H2248_003623 [Termitomyces sp. 'cryptogamus']
MAGPAASMVSATPGLAEISGASSQNAPTKESMKLDYTNRTLVPMEPYLKTLSPVIPGPSETKVVTTIATCVIPEVIQLTLYQSAGQTFCGQFPLCTAEWLHYGELAIFTHLLQQPVEVVNSALAAVEEPFSGSPPLGAAPSEVGPLSAVVRNTPCPSATPTSSSEDMPTEEMELDYHNTPLLSLLSAQKQPIQSSLALWMQL